MRTHHQPVGEVGPHYRPPVASLVGVVLFDVVSILISRVQDNNLKIRYIYCKLFLKDLYNKEKEPAPHAVVASLELIEVII